MFIDVPVIIKIDCQQLSPANYAANRPVSERVFTMRLDIDNSDGPITYCNHYPARKGATFFVDTGDVFATALGNDEYRKLLSRARANPYDYCTDEAEGERLQAKADAEKEPSDA